MKKIAMMFQNVYLFNDTELYRRASILIIENLFKHIDKI